jgi:uncharacterized membrane protein YbhN (UPF0104 family)
VARVKRSHVLLGVLGAGVIAATFLVVLPEIASYGSVADRLRTLTATEIALLVALAALNVLTFAPPLMAALPGLGFWRALSSSQIGAAFAHVLPAGDAVGAGAQVALYRRWGFSPHAIAVALALVGAANGLFFVILPPLGLILLQLGGHGDTPLLVLSLVALAALLAIGAVVAAVIRSEDSARRAGAFAARVARRGPSSDWGGQLARFRHEGIDVLRRRWLPLALATAANNLAVFACVVACLHVCGAGVSWQEILVAWSLTRLLLLIPITPGGIGFVELGMTGLLVAFGGDNSAVVAGVLLERALTFLPPIALGAVFGAALGVRRPAAD